MDATWLRSAGCIEYHISGRGFSERIVLQAIPIAVAAGLKNFANGKARSPVGSVQ